MSKKVAISAIHMTVAFMLCNALYPQGSINQYNNMPKTKMETGDELAVHPNISMKKNDKLFHYNSVEAFISGKLYDGNYTYKALLEHGDFGLAAAHKIDGEVTILDGKIYQTKANGKTSELKLKDRTPLAFVSDLSVDLTWTIDKTFTKETLEKHLKNRLKKTDYIYAIKISGTFNTLKTRTYRPVLSQSYPEFSEVVKNQQLFKIHNVIGSIVGFFVPPSLKGVNVPGFHFHFLSEDKKHGGHVLDLEIDKALVEVGELKGYVVHFSEHQNFQTMDANK
ncbi:acetolactate decarboxylase [Flagellimonas marina]|uniref:Alpha-acetolactate decarboxylase n=1 Tax=Flagellimonas marina TaxID=1775168 RepID=A0ABV8PIR8_9FLAO